jgi:sugar-specific transcriptional regulator TrmB
LLTLLVKKRATIHELVDLLKMDRGNIYRKLKKLENLGLLKLQIGKPTIYSTFPFPIIAKILVANKKREYHKLTKSLEKIAKDIDLIEEETDDKKQDTDYFCIYPCRLAVFCKKWEKTLTNIISSVDLIVTEKREPKNDRIWKIYYNLLQKGVKVRWLIDRSTKNDHEFKITVNQVKNLLLKFPNLELRVCFDSIKPYGGICDDSFVFIFLTSNPPLKCSKTFWTNNKEILTNFKQHFELSWQNAKPYSLTT